MNSESEMEKIEKKVVENKDTTLLRAALKHINILERFRKDVSKTEAFSSRKEYQKLVIAHFFVNELESLELEPDPTSKGFRKPVDDKTPSLEAFHMKPNEKEARRVPHFQRINKGDILHLKVIGETETDYKLIVLNKYGENKRLVDFSLFANLLKSYHLARFCRPLQVSDFLRATVLGKQIMEGNEFSRLIVSVNSKLVNSEYEGVELGLISKADILFYPEDISNRKTMLKYLEKKPFESSKVKKDQMASLGLDPYKIYSFHKPIDGKKYQGPRDLSSWSEKMKKMKISIELLNDYASAYKISDYTSALSLLDQAIENWPMNDSAFAYKGRIFKDLWKLEKKSSHISMAIDNSVRALKLNPNCLIAKNDLHDIYVTSLKTVSKENSTVLQQLIMQIAADNDCSLKWKNSSGLFEKDMSLETLLENLNLNLEDL